MSRRTFYELFPDMEACFIAAFEDGMSRLEDAIAAVVSEGGRWRERIRDGLGALLAFFDEEPAVARVLVIEGLRAGDRALELRRRRLAEVARILDGGRSECAKGREPPALIAEGVVGAVLAIIHAQLSQRDPRPLIELAGSLTAMIVLPYAGPVAAKREAKRSPVRTGVGRHARSRTTNAFDGLGIRLTYRTARVLAAIAEQPGASNRRIATAAGIADEGQTSRLLARLQHAQLVHDTGGGQARGEPKAWWLTPKGSDVQRAIAG
jgi:AcrR family transcriptional regulator